MKLQQMVLVLSVCCVFASVPAASFAQQTSQSGSDSAHRARGQQKQSPKEKVWTNDDLPTAQTVSVVGLAPQQTAEARIAGDVATPASADNGKDLTSEREKAVAELAQAKKDLQSVKTDLDLAQRTYKLDSDQYYSAPDYAANLQGKAKLGSDKDQVSAKQQAVDAAQKKVDDLQKQLDVLNEKLKSTPDSSQPKS